MARHSISGTFTVAPTNVRAGASLFATATVGGTIREIGVFNTTAIACKVAVTRLTNATGVGAGLTEAAYKPSGPAPTLTGFAGHTADGATGGEHRRAPLGAAIGSGAIFTFGDTGLVIEPGTANGIGITCPTGTGQICDYYIDWDE